MTVTTGNSAQPMRILKINHSGVISAWRERERRLAKDGASVALVTAAAWDEGGRPVSFEPDEDGIATPLRTFGNHPNAFLFDPRPLWHLIGERWDVIDIHEEPCSLAAAEILIFRWLRRVRTPVVLYSAQNIAKRYPPPFRWTERWALRQASAVSVCNSAAGRILRNKGLAGQVVLIPLGVDIVTFHPSDRPSPLAGRLRIGYVGRLATHKGVDVLIDSVAMAPTFDLVIVGSGPEEDRLKNQVADRCITDRVTFAGPVSQGQLPSYYASFDVVVVPSRTTASWEEQFCRVVAEAMACGIPVVASRTGSLPEVVGDAGMLVEEGDSQALVTALRRLATEPELWSHCRQKGLDRARAFSWESVTTIYRSLYRALMPAPLTDRGHLDPHSPMLCQLTDGHPELDADKIPLEVIVVAFGRADLLDASLAGLAGIYPVSIVDNSSSTEIRSVAERYGCRYLDPGTNLGFAAGVNLALAGRRCDADILLLNPDAVISGADVHELQRRLHLDPSAACIAPAQVDPRENLPQRVRWPVPTPGRAWLEAVGLGRIDKEDRFVIGSVLMLRSSAIADIGLLDEQFFLYAEETDWQIRAKRHGWVTAFCPDIVATHLGAGTGGDPVRREALFHASTERLVRKYHGAVGWKLFRAANIGGAALRCIVRPQSRRESARRRLSLYWRGPGRSATSLIPTASRDTLGSDESPSSPPLP